MHFPSLLCLLALSWTTIGCKCNHSSERSQGRDAATAVANIRLCRDGASRRLTLAPLGAIGGGGVAGAPFAVELGRALLVKESVLVPFLRADALRSEAGVAILPFPSSKESAQVLELGQVIGAEAPPVLASDGARLYVGLSEGDASGGHYRIGSAELVGTLARGLSVEWEYTLDTLADDSPAFDLAASAGVVVAVWDEWNRARGRSEVVLWSKASDEKPSRRVVSPTGTDAARPRLQSRRGGFWLTWIAHGRATSAAEGNELLADQVPRWLEAVLLDGEARVEATAVRLTKEGSVLRAVDLAVGHDGSLLAAWQSHPYDEGLDGGEIGLVGIDLGGTVSAAKPSEVELAPGVPQLSFDPSPQGGAPHAWLSAASPSGSTLLAALGPGGESLEELSADSRLGSGGVLAAVEGQILVSRARGRGADLRYLRCVEQPSSRDR